jgi:glucokinase
MSGSEEEFAIGVDLGATKIASALVDRNGRVVHSRQAPTLASQGAAAVCERIAEEIRALLWEARDHDIAGIGIGSPGLVDSTTGIVRGAINLRWEEVHLADEVRERVGGIATYVEKDANVNAIGEGMFGSAVGSRDYALLTIGSGLGCGAVSGGALIRGVTSIAGDLGHFAIDPDHGQACPCGKRGCAETVVSGPGLTATHGRGLAPAAVLEAARQGDLHAAAAVQTMATWLGHCAAIVAAVINPDTMIIGGGLGVAAFDLVREPAEREMYRRISPILRDTITLKPATLVSPAIGAASIVWLRAEKSS